MEQKNWYVICYDITEPKRWRHVYKRLHGYGRRLQYSIFRCRLTALGNRYYSGQIGAVQYSIFRCRLTARQMERLRWELEKIMTEEDRLLILSLCDNCERRVATHNRPESWLDEARSFEIA